jgi:nucleotide-binding universal stress UspA family protein
MATETVPGTRPVVVGVDGSDSALAAVRWAAAEARRRRAPLRLVTAFSHTPTHVVGLPALGGRLGAQLMTDARRLLADAVSTAAEAEPDVVVTSEVRSGFPVAVLLAEADRARLLVLGSRGLGGVAGLLVGSVAVAVTSRVACPVAVVRGAAPDTGPVVVGVDGTPTSEAAIALAYQAASERAVPLIALHAWTDVEPAPGFLSVRDWQAVADRAEVVLAERLAGWGAKYPDVAVRRVVARDGAARALVELSEQAQLVVVGSHGHGAVSGLLLGSVSHAALHSSHCPVVVVRSSAAQRPS